MSREDWAYEGWEVRHFDEAQKTVTLRRRTRADLDLLPQAAGWVVALMPGNHRTKFTVRADPGTAVKVTIEQGWTRGVRIEGRSISVHLPRGLGAGVELGTTVREIAAAGTHTINGAVPYRLVVDAAGASISGSAPLRQIAGAGRLVLKCNVESGSGQQLRPLLDGYSGDLTLETAVHGVKIDSAGIALISNGHIEKCSIRVGSLGSSANVHDSEVTVESYFYAAEVRRSQVMLTSEHQVGPGVVVARSRTLDVPAVAISDGNLMENYPWAVHPGPVVESTIEVMSGDIVVGEATDATLIAPGSVRCTAYSAINALTRAVDAGNHIGIKGPLSLMPGLATKANGLVQVGGHVSDGTVVGVNADLASVSGSRIEVSDLCTIRGGISDGSIDADSVRVLGAVRSTEIVGNDVSVRGHVEGGTIRASNIVWDQMASTDEHLQVVLEGSSSLPGGFLGNISWKPVDSNAQLQIAGSPAAITVSAKTPVAAFEVAAIDGPAPALRVTGRVEVTVTSAPDAGWRVQRLTLVGAKCSLGLASPKGVSIAEVRSTNTGTEIVNHDGLSLLDLQLADCSGLKLAGGGTCLIRAWSTDEAVKRSLEASGALHLKLVSGEIGRLNCHKVSGVEPRLDVAADVVVHDLRGDLSLGSVEGRAEGPLRRSFAKGMPASPRIWDVEEQSAGRNTGMVTGIDPTHVKYGALANVEGFHVFEPDPRTLMAWAKDRDRPTHEQRKAASLAQRIAEQVGESAASGSARSAAQWSAARTHAGAVPRLSVERPLRFVHRLFGYSQRPAPALLTYLVVVVGWTAVSCVGNLVRDEYHPSNLVGRVGLALKIAVHPASFVTGRVPQTSDQELSLFADQGWNFLVFLTTGVALVFSVVALRNFMRAPGSGS